MDLAVRDWDGASSPPKKPPPVPSTVPVRVPPSCLSVKIMVPPPGRGSSAAPAPIS